MSVYLGRSAAAATWPLPWESFQERSPEIARELVVRWETPSLASSGLIVRDDVRREVADAVASAFFRLHTHEEGRRLLAAIPVSRFEPATETSYQPVRDFLAAYREVIR